jgi:thiol-disulfide isomerase/thioredoxin
MSATPSTMLPLGTEAPEFNLTDVITGKKLSLTDFSGKTLLLVMFICRHCPYVKHVQDQLAEVGFDYVPKNVGIIAVSSNDADHYPDDSPESLREMSRTLKFNFFLCYDESQETAKVYKAACTPEFYLFDQERKLVYRGQLDDSRPKNDLPVTGKDLRAALDAALAGKAPMQDQKPSIGCNIKWKPGNEPDYFNH